VIDLERVVKTYPIGAGLTVLKGVSLSIRRGEYVGIVGASGSGKSTLLHIMGLLDRPTQGQVRFLDRDTGFLADDDLAAMRGHSIGFVFQSFHLIPRLSLLENVELPLFYQRVPRRERRRMAERCLASVHLSNRIHHLPSEISGGECQRAAIARALAPNPPLLLADEPTGNLDSKTGQEIMALLEELNAQGHTVILITHDPAIAARVPRTIRIADGQITEDTRK
jgi:putative ABC transport system ATP-binding protein